MSPRARMRMMKICMEAEDFVKRRVRELDFATAFERLVSHRAGPDKGVSEPSISTLCAGLGSGDRAEMVQSLMGMLETLRTKDVLMAVLEILVEVGPEVVPMVEQYLTPPINPQQCLVVHRVIFNVARQLTEVELMRLHERLDAGCRRCGGSAPIVESFERVIATIDRELDARA